MQHPRPSVNGLQIFPLILKDMGKRPNGPRLPIDVEGGQVVLDSLLQTPLGLQDQDAPAVKKSLQKDTVLFRLFKVPKPSWPH